MYYLNDRHPEFEYAVYCKVGQACPYLVPRTFESMNEVNRFIEDTEKKHNRYGKIFYIDNDFYENHYNINANGVYYKILRRRVSDWEEFYTKNNNIINIFEYKMRR